MGSRMVEGGVNIRGKRVVRGRLALAVSQVPLGPGETAGNARPRDASSTKQGVQVDANREDRSLRMTSSS